ncbi:tyrosine-type recombinase/integrase [Maribacter sp. 2-571]|uniref:tyrosine-type recombinase/integrase n=1 Tax=Maribacter sp. 2-571 TaxID=3417569 RepID=UPI003D32AC92
MDYEEHLRENDYSKTTIAHYLQRLEEFTNWSRKQRIRPENIDYRTGLKYIKHLQQKGMAVQTINNHIVTLRNYFDHLTAVGLRPENPLEGVSVKGAVKRVLHNLLDGDELEDLYYSYETETFSKYAKQKVKWAAKRNKVVTGLLVYQGLNTTNLKSLLLEHLELYKGKLYVPSTRRNNPREMELKPWQVMNMLEYINEIRPRLAKDGHIENDKLFIPQNHFNDMVRVGILKRLKKINRKVTNVNHLRASVIVNWLGRYNIRKVQYLAGHKYISSTESYRQDNLENLQEAVNQYHPLS